MHKNLVIALVMVGTVAYAQEADKAKEKPVFHEVSNKEVVMSVYPDAVKVEKVNNFWYRILDKNKKVLGFAMSSMPFCLSVKGYNDHTPVMIITDKTWKIQKVSILSNFETLGYVRRLERKGFFKLWDGKTLKEAKKVQIDGYSGATCTATAVSKNVSYLLENGTKKLPKTK
ncbi:MAG: FMN-binding domain protein [Bacteroidetes bacterium]|nr:FMN-binding domain protein [Bacteroidota bacterium]